jgi:hypothetical protein
MGMKRAGDGEEADVGPGGEQVAAARSRSGLRENVCVPCFCPRKNGSRGEVLSVKLLATLRCLLNG